MNGAITNNCNSALRGARVKVRYPNGSPGCTGSGGFLEGRARAGLRGRGEWRVVRPPRHARGFPDQVSPQHTLRASGRIRRDFRSFFAKERRDLLDLVLCMRRPCRKAAKSSIPTGQTCHNRYNLFFPENLQTATLYGGVIFKNVAHGFGSLQPCLNIWKTKLLWHIPKRVGI